MEKLRQYFEAFGSADWNTVGPLFEDVFHDDLVIVTADGELGKDEWRTDVQRAVAAGTKISDIEMHRDTDDTFHYSATITEGDGKVIKISSTGTIKDGKLARVQPLDPAAYSQFVADLNK